MGKGLSLGLLAAWALFVSAGSLEAQGRCDGVGPACSMLLRVVTRLVPGLLGHELARILPAFPFAPQAQSGGGDGGGGGGDGGGGGGGAGDGGGGSGSGSGDGGGSSDGGSGDGGSTDGSSTDSSAAAADAAATDAADPGAVSDPTAVAVDPTAVTVSVTSPTDPTTVTVAQTADPTSIANEVAALTDPVAISEAIQSIPTTDPRGGDVSSAPASSGSAAPGGEPGPGGAVAPGVPGPAPPGSGGGPEDVVIRGVIVSGAMSPWDAITRAPGVRNVTVVGGIIALGQTPLPGEVLVPGGRAPPRWLRLIPDLDLESGKRFPPVVPNIIDVRILYFPVEAQPAGTPGN